MNTNECIKEHKIIVIVRGTYGQDLLHLAEALQKGGARLMEVTFDQNDPQHLEKTCGAIEVLNREFYGAMCFGAGTVLSGKQVDAAAQAGAAFMISPNTCPEVIHRTKELDLTSIPGAATPTEILAAHDNGADFVKLFPAATLGLRYAKDILAPINHVKLIATAGITEENFAQFLQLGFAGAGISGRLTDKKLIREGNWEEFTRRMENFVEIAKNENGPE
jgi:2-dehydro-3-deoxyphosphogluconate aldolase/(4S)-4-hydroxy-2-oxoglutarate aldolase